MASKGAAPAEKTPTLAAWAGARAKAFAVIAEKRDADGPAVDRALSIVRDFIAARRLILYGGLAIDYALRLAGQPGIYPDHARPDYDFFSPRHADDAYDLAEILHAAGFPHAAAIRALHVQTMKVKVDGIFVADISYAPASVFDSFPTFDYAGLRILHPDYQRLDIHLALCFPYSYPPRETLYHRYRKDVKRFNLLEASYPLAGAAAADGAVATGGAAARSPPGLPSSATGTRITCAVDLGRVALHGFAAYAAIREALVELAAAAAQISTADLDAARSAEASERASSGLATPIVDLVVRRRAPGSAGDESGSLSEVELGVPAGLPARLTFASPWPAEVAATIGAAASPAAAEWFDPIMDSRPIVGVVRLSGGAIAEVYSTRRQLLATYCARVGKTPVRVVSPQFLLLDLLYRAQRSAEAPERATYFAYYKHTLDILAAGEALINAMRTSDDPAYRRLIASGPFGVPVTPFGDSNADPAYIFNFGRSARVIGDPAPPESDASGLPPGYHVDQAGAVRPRFSDYEAHPAYRRAGAPRSGPPS